MQAHNKGPGLPRDRSTAMPLNSASGYVAFSLVDHPTLRFKELLQMTSAGRSQNDGMMNSAPDFPKSILFYKSEKYSKFYWTHEAITGLRGRAHKARTVKEGC